MDIKSSDIIILYKAYIYYHMKAIKIIPILLNFCYDL